LLEADPCYLVCENCNPQIPDFFDQPVILLLTNARSLHFIPWIMI
jgi:hypothetical protein